MSEVRDLTAAAGLPMRIDLRTGELRFEDDATSDPPGARRLGDIRDVLREPAATGHDLLYHLYRAVRRTRDEPLLARAGLRYDLTVTLPGTLGAEYAKTMGHYHPVAGDGVSFPEVYEVVHGRAAFVLQRVDDVGAERPRIEEVRVQVCAAGERILIPPDCGHVTVNIGSEPLVVADLISLRCGHIYGTFKALRGAAWYVLADPGAEHCLRLERNPAYGDVPEPTVSTGSRWEPFLDDGRPAYLHVRARPDDYAFLDRPAASADALLALWR